ncbi:AzlC family ABC transporter permease [Fictibacillus enclensis]|uniref:Branched-chain amino acid ABC transporter permease n=1 Tax=Fictibacillus enclensis TaxID=1017270 RepID=A0A0V8JAE7_9BACL|nr:MULTISPECIES: AzlC family ABC transporter permease [Fictibacillus]KSU84146.1 branched-chain amino acid ABC transporter permease [Fictibacillus enclensis]MDM5336904.1 AzlC family ABC transporter permease [Fictibacillus enclensis]RXZ00240.1 branched-chain amino acid ABC transporter permease [Fictibacillus sp. S7]WHY73325.1 AzlC family ABC transporter permease [Fictibacillus enclensis]SCB73848.1 4-azaleucine resistance probable transporter AzlC [Fictibacillus enclensis]
MIPIPAISAANHDFKRGIQAGLSIAIGYLPIAFTYGLLAKSSGLSLLETVGMSIIVFAGASQYIALSMIAAGTGAFEIIITAFIMNIRHLLMSASLNEKMEEDTKWRKAVYGFLITDETFSVAATRTERKLASSFMLGLGLTAYGSWVINSGIGYLIGAGLPETIQAGMAVALYAMFIGLLVPSAKKSSKVILLAGTAALLNSLFSLYEPLSGGWGIILSTIISAAGIEFLMKEEAHGN